MYASIAPAAAPNGPELGDSPPPPKPCDPHLTRPADDVISMVPNVSFYKSTLNATITPPTETFSIMQTASSFGCKRWVVEMVVPSSASSGCSECYDWAEILMGASQFRGSTKFEKYFYRPTSNTPTVQCNSYRHKIAVYTKLNGAEKFNAKPSQYYYFVGRIKDGQCRVYHDQGGGVIHNTSEVFGIIQIPGSGTNYYRVMHHLEYGGSLMDTVTVVEFEETHRNVNSRNKKINKTRNQ